MLPFAIIFMFGRLTGRPRQGYAIVAVMAVIFLAHTVVSMQAELHGNHLLPASVSQAASDVSPGGNMEGKETRFGPQGSALMTVGTMGTTAGATDSALDSYTPVGGTGAFVGILLGEISPGGDGDGLYSILVLALLSVFVAGLMVGRTPEFLGKKIRAPQMKLVVAYVLVIPIMVLSFAGLSLVISFGTASILNPGCTACPRSPTPTPRWRTTTGPRSPGWRPTRRGTTSLSASPCSSGVSRRSCWLWPSPAR